MPYIVTNSDGSLTVSVQDSVVDTTTYSLALIGRNVSNFGQYFAQNTVRHLENFASAVPPTPATRLIGQMWYDKGEKVLKVWDGVIWKRATNIVVGSENERPNYGLVGGGAAFYNTSTDKLEVHNGTQFLEASYAGEVTNRFTGSENDGNPTFYGTRVRTIFLKGHPIVNGETIVQILKEYPVLVMTYTKTTGDELDNPGHSDVGEKKETMMALFSDDTFELDGNYPYALIDGYEVDVYAELTEEGTAEADGGIAASRRFYDKDDQLIEVHPAGIIQKGLNIRREYELSGTVFFDQVFANRIGSVEIPVEEGYFIYISADEILTKYIHVTQNADIDGDLVVGGNITSTGGVISGPELEIDVKSTLNGDTFVNGNFTVNGGDILLNGNVGITGQLTINGDNIDKIGSLNDRIEEFYGDDAVFGNVTVDNQLTTLNLTATGEVDLGNVTITDLHVTGTSEFDGTVQMDSQLTMTGSADIQMTNGKLIGYATKSETTLVASAENGTHYIAMYNTTTGDLSSYTDGGLTYDTENDTLYASVFNGVATSARYADLAEIYESDFGYSPGTVVKLGGEKEITQTIVAGDTDVFGVISTDPAYLMNSEAEGLPVAMTGRVPVRVRGEIKKGDRLISSGEPGIAMALGNWEYDPRMIIGRALQDHSVNPLDGSSPGLIEAVIGVK